LLWLKAGICGIGCLCFSLDVESFSTAGNQLHPPYLQRDQVMVENDGSQPCLDFEHSSRQSTPLPPWMFAKPDLHDEHAEGCTNHSKIDSGLNLQISPDMACTKQDRSIICTARDEDFTAGKCPTGLAARNEEPLALSPGGMDKRSIADNRALAAKTQFCYMGGLLLVKLWFIGTAGHAAWSAGASCQELALRQQLWVDSFFELDPSLSFHMAERMDSLRDKRTWSIDEVSNVAALEVEAARRFVDSWFELV